MKILIADDHQLMLDGIRSALERCEDLEIVGEAHSGSEVLPLIGRTNPDVVLLDMRMPGMDGLTCLERIRERYPQRQGRRPLGFHDARAHRSRLQARRVRLHRQERQPARPARGAPPGLRRHGLPRARASPTRPARPARQRSHRPRARHPKAVARGLSNQAIGKELWVTEQTVKFHLTNIYRKLGVANRTEAARYAFEHDLAETPRRTIERTTH